MCPNGRTASNYQLNSTPPDSIFERQDWREPPIPFSNPSKTRQSRKHLQGIRIYRPCPPVELPVLRRSPSGERIKASDRYTRFMLDRLREFVRSHGLIGEDDRILVGYSGGADSTCLLHLLHRAKIDVAAATLHHGQRPEAEEELERAAAFAELLKVPFVAGRADVPAMAKALGIGLEEAGREARYAFFEESAMKLGCGKVATAHTRSDHAETVLLNLTRGSGLAGLGGIPVQRNNIIRPLLFAAREETQAYCHEHGLAFTEDPANTDISFARSRVRALVVPELKAINPAFESAAERLAAIAEEEDSFLDAAAAAALERTEIPLNGELRFLTLDAEARLDREFLRHLPPVLRKRGIRLVVEALGARLSFDLTRSISESILGLEIGSITAEGGGVTLTWNADHLHVSKSAEEPAFRHPMAVPGVVRHEELGWQIQTALAKADGATPRRQALDVRIDVDGFRGPLHFRSFEPGDTMRPIGGVGTRKLADLMSEEKLTLLARRRMPIICDIIGPIWAPGVALDERVRVSPGSSRALQLVFAPLPSNHGLSETEPNPETYANR